MPITKNKSHASKISYKYRESDLGLVQNRVQIERLIREINSRHKCSLVAFIGEVETVILS